MVVNEFMRSDHALRWHNLRFYYNPETKKIEPIGFDCGTWFPKTKDIYYKSNGVELFHRLMLKDEAYVKIVDDAMKAKSERAYLDKFYAVYWKDIQKAVKLVKIDNPDYKYWKTSLYKSQVRIHELFNAPSE